jgi:hypothetical protein
MPDRSATANMRASPSTQITFKMSRLTTTGHQLSLTVLRLQQFTGLGRRSDSLSGRFPKLTGHNLIGLRQRFSPRTDMCQLSPAPHRWCGAGLPPDRSERCFPELYLTISRIR